MAARAAGLNSDNALARPQDLERRGEVQRIGKRWSTASPQSDVAAAMDRLQAQTNNLRIVRERARVSRPAASAPSQVIAPRGRSPCPVGNGYCDVSLFSLDAWTRS